MYFNVNGPVFIVSVIRMIRTPDQFIVCCIIETRNVLPKYRRQTKLCRQWNMNRVGWRILHGRGGRYLSGSTGAQLIVSKYLFISPPLLHPASPLPAASTGAEIISPFWWFLAALAANCGVQNAANWSWSLNTYLSFKWRDLSCIVRAESWGRESGNVELLSDGMKSLAN